MISAGSLPLQDREVIQHRLAVVKSTSLARHREQAQLRRPPAV
jgi:hypothetical protein